MDNKKAIKRLNKEIKYNNSRILDNYDLSTACRFAIKAIKFMDGVCFCKDCKHCITLDETGLLSGNFCDTWDEFNIVDGE